MNASMREQFEAFIHSGGFDSTLKGHLVPLEVGGGRASARLNVAASLLNVGQNLHGAVYALLVDVIGTFAIMTADKQGRPGVTTDLNITCCAAVPAEDSLTIEARVLRSGRNLAYVTVDMFRESDGALAAQGRMTKYLGA
jgi:acyl-coenzyme A thioesterase 13